MNASPTPEALTTFRLDTDAAVLALFDPETLPDGFIHSVDRRRDVIDRSADADEPADDTGHDYRLQVPDATHVEPPGCCWIETSGDGEYTLGVLVDTDIPEYLDPFLEDLGTIDAFPIRGGELILAGAEYAYDRNRPDLRESALVSGGALPVSPGDYRLTAFVLNYPEEDLEDDYPTHMVRGRVSEEAFRTYREANDRIGCGCAWIAGTVLATGAFLSTLIDPRGISALAVVFATLVLVAGINALGSLTAARRLKRTDAYRLVEAEVAAMNDAYPSLLVVLTPISTHTGLASESRGSP